jgi:TRAP-type C4-dicarboxylate transport system substrate-binding protein
MKLKTRTWLIVAVLIAALALPAAAQAKTYNLTMVAGHPPIFLWVSLSRDFFIPEVNKRLEEAGGKDQVKWNEAYGGTVAKIGGVLEAIEMGVADIGFVGTLFEAPKMPLHNVTYMTPFGSSDIFVVVDTVTDLQEKIPAFADEWSKHNQVFLGGAGLDTYGVLSNFPIHSVADIDGHKLAAPGPAANWIKNTGAVAVAGNLNTYYNDIKTGVYEGTLTFMTAAAAGKLHEVAPHVCMVNFGAQFAGGLSLNKDVFESFPPYMREIFQEVGQEWARKLAEAQANKAEAAMETMKEGGAEVVYLSDEKRAEWAHKLPNVPMEWAATMDEKGLPGTQTVKGFLDGLRERGVQLPRDWDKE